MKILCKHEWILHKICYEYRANYFGRKTLRFVFIYKCGECGSHKRRQKRKIKIDNNGEVVLEDIISNIESKGCISFEKYCLEEKGGNND